MRRIGLICLGILGACSFAIGQNSCGIMVEAGDPQSICNGGSTTLNGSVTGGNSPTWEWTPAAGLSDPTSLTPTASPAVTTTYTLTAMANSDNLIVNGGFETASIAPATSNYTEVSDPVAIATNAPNYYGILSVPQIVQAFGCTPDIGQYTMVIHGSTGVGVDFWCQTIPVTPNTDYKFEYTVFGILYFFAPAPEIVLKVNGVQIGSITAPNSLCGEATQTFTWNSGASTSADVCFANATVAGLGSMCSIDDISMVECCVESDTVTVTVLPEIEVQQDYVICEGESVDVGGQSFNQEGNYEVVLTSFQGCDSTIQVQVNVVDVEAFVSPPAMITCLVDQVLLDGSGSVGEYGINSYSWTTTNGLILSNPSSPSVDVGAPGVYTLTVTTTNGQVTCSEDLDVSVEIDTISPVFTIDPPLTPPCDNPVVTLTANGNNLPPNASAAWSTWNGQILSGGNTLMPTVSGSGIYTLLVTDPSNGCFSLDSIQVQADTNKPVIQPLVIPDISCRDSQVVISVAVPAPTTGYTALWTTTNGNILSGATTLIPLVNAGGTYLLTVTDSITGCTSTLDALVDAFTDPPTPTLPVPDTITCLVTSLSIPATVGPGFDSLSIQWSTPNGQLLSGQDSLTVEVGSGGIYTLQLEDLATGCRDSASVTVISNIQLPAAEAGPDLVIDCSQSSVVPMTSGSSTGPEFSYAWTRNGMGFPGDTLLQPTLNGAGTYILQVTNISTGCVNTDTLTVSSVAGLPTVQISPADTLDCIHSQLTLDASGSSQGNHVITWSGPAGGLLSGTNGLTPTIGQPGWYVLSILDTTNQCQAVDSVLVIQDIQPPVPSILPADSLDCLTTSVVLDASASTSSGPTQYLWSTTNGNIVSGAMSATPLVNGGGTYTLLLTNPDNGCTALDSVIVFQDPDLPVASILDADTLTCLVTSVNLEATYQGPNPNVTFTWTTPDGTILSGGTTLMPVVGGPGTYVFELTDPLTGCMTSDQVVVVENTFVPIVTVPNPDTLDCLNNQIVLEAQPVNYSGTLEYVWTTTNGMIIGPATGNPVTVNAAGQYQVQWTVPENGCSNGTSQTVIEDIQSPIADAGPDAGLPCNGQNLQLDGSGSTGQGILTYSWSTTNGMILSGAGTALPLIGQAGTYLLTVTDQSNGCSATDEVIITATGSLNPQFNLTLPVCNSPGEITFTANGATPPVSLTIQGVAGSFSPGEIISLPAGTWPLTVTDGSGCILDTTLVMPAGQDLILSAPASLSLSPGSTGTIQLNVNVDPAQITSITWNPNTGISPTGDPLIWTIVTDQSSSWEVTVTTIDGCTKTASIMIEVLTTLPVLFVPNAFSPNDLNGINDRFFPSARPGTITSVKNMAIYDRWGNSLFMQEDFPPNDADYGWDGTYRDKPLDPGVYVWVIEVLLADGEVRVYKGDVTLF